MLKPPSRTSIAKILINTLVGGMLAILPSAVITPSANAAADVPFTCSAAFYQATTTNSSLYGSSIVASKLVYNRIGTTVQTNLNAIGYNTADNLIYGIGGSGSSMYVYKVDATGTMTKVGSTALSGITSSPGSGDFIAPNKLLVINTGTVNATNAYNLIDVKTLTVTPVKNNGPAAYPSGAGDWAISNNIGYGMASSTIYKFDTSHALDASPYISITSAAVTADATPLTGNTSVAATSSSGFGAAYMDRTGNTFFYDNGTSKVYEITAARLTAGQYQSQLVGGAATTPTLSAPNDGASCPNAPSPYDPPTPSDDNYNTVVGSGGNFTTVVANSNFPALLDNDSWNSTGFTMNHWRLNSSDNSPVLVSSIGTSPKTLNGTNVGTVTSFNAANGIFSFTSSAIGTGSFQYDLLEPVGTTPSALTHTYATATINVLGFGSTPSQSGTLNNIFSYQVPILPAGTTVPFTTTMTGCAPGLSISSAGLITGTPTSNGTYTCAVTLTVNGKTVTQNVTITISSSSVTLTYDSNPPAGSTASTPASVTTTTGSGITIDTTTAISGYALTGWNTAANGSGTTYTPGSTFTITANATLYAVWTPISVNVIWNTNGGSSGPANQTYTYPNNLTTIPSGPTPPSGYTFNSWRTGPLCTDPGVSTGSLSFASATTVTFYACFTPISYNVTYDLNGGSSFSGGTNPSTTFTVASNYRISSVTGVHSTSGYNFLGWYTAISGGTLVAAGSPWATPGNVTFYAHWGISQYNVGYDANGGTGAPAGSTVNDQVHVTIASLSTLSRPGYLLVGWNTQADGNGTAYSPGDDYKVNGASITFYAQWVPVTYVITYDANGGTGLDPNTTFTVATPGSINSNTFTRNGYTFAGWWNTARGGSGTSYSPGDTYGNPLDLQLFAQWTANTYTISYNGNGATSGSGPASSTSNITTFTYGSNPVILGLNTWALSGAKFVGWNTKADGSGFSYNEGDIYPAAANLVLYATWVPLGTYVVTYDPNGGTGGPATQRFTEGGSVVIQGTAPTRTGYDFAGWWNSSSSGSGATYAPGDVYRTLANLTLFAQWVPHSWDVAYDANGGTGNAPAQQHFTIPYTVTISDAGSLIRTGYLFDGWNTKADGTGQDFAAADIYGQDSDLLLYAVWTPITYVVTYDPNGATGGTAPASETFTVETPAGIDGNTHSLVKVVGSNTYTFAGWNTDSTGAGTSYSAGSSYNQPANLDLFAIWVAPSTYVVTYDPNGGVLGSGQVGSQTFTSSVTIQSGTPVRSGYTFNGWNSAINGSGNSYINPDVYSTPANLTLFATWVLDEYRVIYDANGGTGTVSSQTFDVAHPDVISSTSGLSRSGYTIAGWWNSTSTATGSTFAPGDRYRQPANLTLYAIWVLNNYEVAYDMNGGSGTAPTTQSFTVEAPATIANGHSFTLAGKKFVGWSTETSTVTTIYAPNDRYSEPQNLLLFAIWEDLNNFTVTYDTNGLRSVTGPAAQTFTAGSSVTIASALNPASSTGYTFAGWNTKADGSGNSYAAGVDVYSDEADMLLYAIWTPIEYKVLYIANGGVGTTPTPTTFDVEHPATIKDLAGATLNRPGYIFVGWNTSAAGSGSTYAAGDVYGLGGGDLHLYAIWDLETFALSFDLNGGDTSTAYASETFTAVDGALIPKAIVESGSHANPVRTGYVFRGWNTKADGTGVEYQGGDTYVIPEDRILYAQWVIASQWEIDFNTHGGTPAPLHIFFPQSGSPYVRFTDPGTISRPGYHLANVGWCNAATGGTCITTETATVNANMTYHLQWETNTVYVTYNFNAGGGNVFSGTNHTTVGTLHAQQSFTYRSGSATIDSNTFYRPGYTFDGWNSAADGTGENFAGGDTYLDYQDITLYAIWTLSEYRIEFDANGANGNPPATVTFTVANPGTISYPTNLAYPWKIFQGWNTNMNGTAETYTVTSTSSLSYGAASNLYLFAQWGGSKNYTITYDANGGSGTAPGPFTFNIDNLTGDTSTITIRDVSTTFTRTGYTFLGLNDKADGSGTTWSVGDLYTEPADVTLYAIWQCNSCSTGGTSGGGYIAPAAIWHINYFANGGTGSTPTSSDVNDGSLYTIKYAGGLVRSGYTFSGWNTDPNGSGNSYQPGLAYTVASNVTLYAMWAPVNAPATPTPSTPSGGAPTPSTPTPGTPVTGNGGSSTASAGTLTRHVTAKKVIRNQIVSITQTVSLATPGESQVKDVLVNGIAVQTNLSDPTKLVLPNLVGPADKVVVEVKKADGTVEEVRIKPTADPIQLANVNFALSSYALDLAAKKILDKVISVIKNHGFSYVDLVGHTDSQGVSSGYDNNTLSVERAKQVRAYLQAHLSKKITIRVEGKAHVDPVASNLTKSGQAANRRVEIDVH